MGVPISNVTRRVVYAASGTGPYNFTFEILAAGDVAVYRDDTLLTLTTDYTVTINPNGTGFITLTAAPTGATQIAIVGNRTIQRSTDFVTGGDFFANTVNAELDQQTIFAQQNAEGLQRALQAPQTDPTSINMTLPRKADRAGKYLAFDENGDPKPGDTAIEVAAVAAIADEIATVGGISSQVVAVAGNATNVNTVAGISSNVTTVAGISANVTTVAGNTTNINTVAGANSNISTVAGSIANVNAVGTNISNVNAVNSNATNINTVAGQITPTNRIQTLAGISADITTVAGISSNVTSVAGNSSNINTVATNIANVNSVGGNIANVNAVAGNATNINAVNANKTNIDNVAGNSANIFATGSNISSVNTVALSIGNVITNASNIANINQNAANITAIQNASTNATNAAASATSAETSATNAAASAAAASAVALGNEPVRPLVRPSLLLDFANTKQLDPRITFTRASTGTFYDGRTVAKAEENLLTQSGNVSIWTQAFGLGSITANSTTAPDGTTTAGLVIVDNTTGRHFVGSQRGGIVPIGTTITGSVFLKASTYGFASVQLSNATSASGTPRYTVSVDLSNGTIGGFTGNTGVSGQSASAISVGNGWYRVVLTMTTTVAGDGAGLNILVTPMPTNGSGYSDGGAILPAFTGDGTSGIFVWGAQVEQRSSVTAYTPTTTAPITNYIPALQTAASGVARFEHNPITGESLGLEIEEQRTNLLTYSDDFGNAAWARSVVAVTANAAIAPDGTLTADWFREGTGNNFQNAFQAVSQTAATHTFSAYVKKGQSDRFVMFAGSPQALMWIDMNTWTAYNSTNLVSSSITHVGNGWYRCTMVYTNSGSGTFQTGVNLVQNGSTTAVTYAGNGWNGIFIWGAQLEAGAFATSYIPTVASQVTRSADAASMTGTNFSSWYRQDEGTIYAEAALSSVASTGPQNIWSLFTSATNLTRLWFWEGAPSTMRYTTLNGGATQAELTTSSISASTFFKNASVYKVNDFALSTNAGAVQTDTSGTVTQGLNALYIGNQTGNSGFMNGTIRKIAYFPARVTNAQLQAMTTV